MTQEIVSERLVDILTAAEHMSVSRSTVYELMETGQLKWVKIGRARRIPIQAIRDLVAANTKGGWALAEKADAV
ncbi:MAG TPA: helix-turn-helix domain-containing protein [Pirellulales bacterium]|nr:helix-turn-helix domain-containing protein [Pirellulales bacterium]